MLDLIGGTLEKKFKLSKGKNKERKGKKKVLFIIGFECRSVKQRV